jgi:integrase
MRVLTTGLPEPTTMRVKLTPSFVQKARHQVDEQRPGKDRTFYWDVSLRCFGLQVTASGDKRYVIQYRTGRRSRRMAIGDVHHLPIDAARREARKLLGRVAAGGDPLEERRQAERAKTDTFFSISEEFLAREGGKLRSAKQYRAIAERLLYPTLAKDQISAIRRSDIVRLLDKIEDQSGPAMARQAHAVLRRIMTWHSARADDFRSPLVRGLGYGAGEARQRILSDDELRAVFQAAEASPTPFARLVQFLLLTGARRSEAAQMVWSEVDGGVWTLPRIRNKVGVDLVRPLSEAAQELLASMPRLGAYVFTMNGRRPIAGFTRFKSDFDKVCEVTGWTLHDLRRTARSLMSRAGVNADVAEMCLGHKLPGIRSVYDRHAYLEEKRHAFAALAALIGRIVNPPGNNVVSLESSDRLLAARNS